MSENAFERYERLAAEFYEKTGYMAPGKDRPAEMGPEPPEAEKAWQEFLMSKHND